MYVEDDGASPSLLSFLSLLLSQLTPRLAPPAGHTAPIEREIRQLSAALEAVKDEQEYIVVRERLHRDSASLVSSSLSSRAFVCPGPALTPSPSPSSLPPAPARAPAAESTNDRVKYWSIVQTVLLFAVCAWQVFYLKRFFEVKRAV